jgi:hypothetical protein
MYIDVNPAVVLPRPTCYLEQNRSLTALQPLHHACAPFMVSRAPQMGAQGYSERMLHTYAGSVLHTSYTPRLCSAMALLWWRYGPKNSERAWVPLQYGAPKPRGEGRPHLTQARLPR